MEIKRILALALLLSSVAIADVFAYDFMAGGLAYKKKKDGTVAVTMKKKHVKGVPGWDGGYAGNIVVPSSVTNKGRTYKVTEIGDSAFFCCNGVKSVKIPEGIKRFGREAFYCSNITSLHIPASLREIGSACFTGCTFMKKITVAAGNKNYRVEGGCVYNKNKTALVLVGPTVRNYTVPSSVNTILDFAFSIGHKMGTVVIPKTIKYAGGDALWHISFTKLTIEADRVKKITPNVYCERHGNFIFDGKCTVIKDS